MGLPFGLRRRLEWIIHPSQIFVPLSHCDSPSTLLPPRSARFSLHCRTAPKPQTKFAMVPTKFNTAQGVQKLNSSPLKFWRNIYLMTSAATLSTPKNWSCSRVKGDIVSLALQNCRSLKLNRECILFAGLLGILRPTTGHFTASPTAPSALLALPLLFLLLRCSVTMI